MNLRRIALALCAITASAFAADAPKITPVDAAKLVSEGKAVLVDCREPREWKSTGVAAPAVLLAKSDNNKAPSSSSSCFVLEQLARNSSAYL